MTKKHFLPVILILFFASFGLLTYCSDEETTPTVSGGGGTTSESSSSSSSTMTANLQVIGIGVPNTTLYSGSYPEGPIVGANMIVGIANVPNDYTGARVKLADTQSILNNVGGGTYEALVSIAGTQKKASQADTGTFDLKQGLDWISLTEPTFAVKISQVDVGAASYSFVKSDSCQTSGGGDCNCVLLDGASADGAGGYATFVSWGQSDSIYGYGIWSSGKYVYAAATNYAVTPTTAKVWFKYVGSEGGYWSFLNGFINDLATDPYSVLVVYNSTSSQRALVKVAAPEPTLTETASAPCPQITLTSSIAANGTSILAVNTNNFIDAALEVVDPTAGTYNLWAVKQVSSTQYQVVQLNESDLSETDKTADVLGTNYSDGDMISAVLANNYIGVIVPVVKADGSIYIAHYLSGSGVIAEYTIPADQLAAYVNSNINSAAPSGAMLIEVDDVFYPSAVYGDHDVVAFVALYYLGGSDFLSVIYFWDDTAQTLSAWMSYPRSFGSTTGGDGTVVDAWAFLTKGWYLSSLRYVAFPQGIWGFSGYPGTYVFAYLDH